MNSHKQHDAETLFNQWLDGQTLTEDERNILLEDDEYGKAYQAGNWMNTQSECYDNTPVPNWNRASTFSHRQHKPTERPWWQANILALSSMTMSAVAIMLVLLNVQITSSDQGLLITLGDNQSHVEKQLNDRLEDFAAEQQTSLARYIESREQLQQQQTLQMVNYLVDTSRKERKEELNDLVSYINEQRYDDRQTYKHQIQTLKHQLYNSKQKETATPFTQTSFEQE